MHGYFFKKMMSDENIDIKLNKTRAVNKTVSSHFEGYLNAIHDQEIPTKFLINKHQRDPGQEPTCNTKCRLCKNNVEDVNHIISSCPEMSIQFYLPIRHDIVAKTILKATILKENPDNKFRHQRDPEYVYKVNNRILVEYSNTSSNKSTAQQTRYRYMGSREKNMHNR